MQGFGVTKRRHEAFRPQSSHNGNARRRGPPSRPHAGHPLLHQHPRPPAQEAHDALLGGRPQVPALSVRLLLLSQREEAGAPPRDDPGVQRAHERPEPPERVRPGQHAPVPLQDQGRGDPRPAHGERQAVPRAQAQLRAQERRPVRLPLLPPLRHEAHPRRRGAHGEVHPGRDRHVRPPQRLPHALQLGRGHRHRVHLAERRRHNEVRRRLRPPRPRADPQRVPARSEF
mmetsp:Transcript_15070/g.30003  ORF Transcript_15070/g.30003 Transcript_15070/m.30003 type:complete len:229 (+) Transcript_15070:110-796(+)